MEKTNFAPGKKTRSPSPFLITYMVFALLIIASFLPLYVYLSSFVRSTTLSEYQESADRAAARLDSTLNLLNSTVVATTQDNDFLIFKYSNPQQSIDPLRFPGYEATLNNLLIPDDTISDAGIWFSSDIVLMRKAYCYEKSYLHFYPSYISCQGMTEAEWKSFLSNGNILLPVHTYTSYKHGTFDALTYSVPWTDGSYTTKSRFFALISSEKLLNAMTDEEILQNGSIRITDYYGNTILGRENAADDNCYLLSASTDSRLFQITIGVPKACIREKLAPFVRIIIFLTGFIVLFSLIIILLFANRSAQPFHNLLKSVSNAEHVSAEYNRHSAEKTSPLLLYTAQMEQLSQSISAIEQKMQNDEYIITSLRSSLRFQLLDKALHHELEDEEAFCDNYPDFPASYRLCMMRYELQAGSSIDYVAQLQANAIAIIHSVFPRCIIHPFDRNSIVIILAENDLEDTAVLHTLRNRLTQNTGISVGCALSDVFSGIDDIAYAYQQTSFMYASVSDPFILDVEEMKTLPLQKKPLPFSYSDSSAMYTALSSGSLSACLLILEECQAKCEGTDSAILRHTYHQVFHLLRHIVLENPALLLDINIPAYSHDNNQLSCLLPCIETICSRISSERAERTVLFSDKIIEYVNEHLFDTNLYIQDVTAHFSISAPTLQKLFRSNTGKTFASYVEDQRMAKAYDMILNTNKTIQEIAETCGFVSTNTFYKAFHRQYGTSPQAIRPKLEVRRPE